MSEATMLFWLIVILAGACGIGWLALRLILHKGIAFGWTTTKAISMRIRRTDYYERFIALNEPSAAVGDVPLAGNKGVWRH